MLNIISGQLGVDPITNKFVGDTIEDQTVQILSNIEAILLSHSCLDFLDNYDVIIFHGAIGAILVRLVRFWCDWCDFYCKETK